MMNLSRRRVEDAISEIGREEVLDAKMVLAGACTPLQKLSDILLLLACQVVALLFDHLVIIFCKELLLQLHVLHNGLNNKVGSLDGSVHCRVNVHV